MQQRLIWTWKLWRRFVLHQLQQLISPLLRDGSHFFASSSFLMSTWKLSAISRILMRNTPSFSKKWARFEVSSQSSTQRFQDIRPETDEGRVEVLFSVRIGQPRCKTMHRASEAQGGFEGRRFGLMRPRLRSNVFQRWLHPISSQPFLHQSQLKKSIRIRFRSEKTPAPAQLEHSTPAEVELAAAGVVEETWVALARKCRAA